MLITGATGQQGKSATRAGSCARSVVGKGGALAALGAEVVGGNLDDRSSLDTAMTGVHGVFRIIPMVATFMPTTPFEFQLACRKNMIDSADDAKASQLNLHNFHRHALSKPT